MHVPEMTALWPAVRLFDAGHVAKPSLDPGFVTALQELTQGFLTGPQVPSDKQSLCGGSLPTDWKKPKELLQYPLLVEPGVIAEVLREAGVVYVALSGLPIASTSTPKEAPFDAAQAAQSIGLVEGLIAGQVILVQLLLTFFGLPS